MGCRLFPQVRIVAGDPVFATRGEEIGDDGIFEDVDGVGDAGGNLEGLAGAEGDFFAGDVEDELAGVDHGDLLVGVVVEGDVAALFEFEHGDGHAAGVNDAAEEEGGDFFEGDVIPVVDRHRDILTEAGFKYTVLLVRQLTMSVNDQLHGALNLLVLKALTRRGRMHGYAIMSSIHGASAEALKLEQGSLYPALHRMEEAGWIEGEWVESEAGKRVRGYAVTKKGKKALELAEEKWTRVSLAVNRVLEGV
jgi:PadR family transcriptional regulator PadR